MEIAIALLAAMIALPASGPLDNYKMAVNSILADDTIVANVVGLQTLTPMDAMGNYLLVVKDGEKERGVYFDAEQSAAVPKQGRHVFLLDEIDVRGTKYYKIRQFPENGVYDVVELEEIRSATSERTNAIADAFLKGARCQGNMEELVRGLDAERQQESIDRLFAADLTKEDFGCLASSIKSLSNVSARGYNPPYPSWEGTYVHGFKTRGRLIAHLMPHLFSENIFFLGRGKPDGDEFEEKDRVQMMRAWAYWGFVRYGSQQKE